MGRRKTQRISSFLKIDCNCLKNQSLLFVLSGMKIEINLEFQYQSLNVNQVDSPFQNHYTKLQNIALLSKFDFTAISRELLEDFCKQRITIVYRELLLELPIIVLDQDIMYNYNRLVLDNGISRTVFQRFITLVYYNRYIGLLQSLYWYTTIATFSGEVKAVCGAGRDRK